MEQKKNSHENKNNQQSQEKDVQSSSSVITVSKEEYDLLKDEAAKAKQYWERLLRLQADFENARKRWERERADFVRYAKEEIICEILTIVDELEKSVELSQQKHEDYTAFLKGVEMILAHLHELLKRHGVSCIEAKGKCFDANCHEALMQIEDDSLPENTVVEEFQKGYTLNGKVIRTAKVQVSRKKKKDEDNLNQTSYSDSTVNQFDSNKNGHKTE
ncbi:MAG: nucleotide exchange factor GrpE [Candidatus Omnitrophica bacterium]|nr:nucleotide exchange factor GrpE [Candidatus Omnitrophota bacterium]